METLNINHFAGLKEAKIEIGSITLIIGQQATGKSVTAKLIYFFREIGFQITAATIAGRGIEEFKNDCKTKFCRYFPPDSWPPRNFSIVYTNNHEKVCVEYNHDEGKSPTIVLSLSAFYEECLVKFSKRWGELSSKVPEGDPVKKEEARRQFHKEIFETLDAKLGKWSKFQQIFIPAGRAIVSFLQASVFRTLESGQDLDPFLISFGAFVEESKAMLFERRFLQTGRDRSEGVKAFQKMLSTVINGDFKRVKGQDSLSYADGRRVRLAQASSGQQEVLPLLFVLGRFISRRHVSGRSVYIEEPEAHLFPATQRAIVEFMASTYRARQEEMCLVITTHSPYILTAMNNLLQAGKKYSSSPNPEAKKQLEKIIPSSQALYPGEVKAYSLENGEAKSIICPDTNLIDAEIIDVVSQDIAVQFDDLLEDL